MVADDLFSARDCWSRGPAYDGIPTAARSEHVGYQGMAVLALTK